MSTALSSEIAAETELQSGMTSAKRLAFMGVMLVLFLSSFNLTVVGTILPKVVAELGGMDLYAWVFTAYSLATTISIPIFGRLSDIYSRRNVLLWGIVLFAFGSSLMGLVQNMYQLIGLRALQGVGGGALLGISIAALADIFEPRERGKYQGLTGSVYGVSSVVGPLLGGLLADHLGWRWVFPLNLPFALISFWFIARFLPKNPPHENTHIDYPGVILLTLGLVPLLIGLSRAGQTSWQDPLVWALIGGGAVLLIGFTIWQRLSPGPIIEPGLFKNPVVSVSTIAMLFSTAGLYAAILYLPLFMQSVKGMSATISGMVLSPLMLGMVITSSASGWLISHKGRYKALILTGLVMMSLTLAGAGWLLHPESPIWLALLLATFLGCGLGPVNPVFNLIVQLAVPRQEIGAATGVLRFFNQIGGTLGATIFGLLMTQSLTQHRQDLVNAVQTPLPAPVREAVLSPGLLTNAPLMQKLHEQLHSSSQLQALEQAIHALRQLLSLSLNEIFLWAALFSALAFLITLCLPSGLLKSNPD